MFYTHLFILLTPAKCNVLIGPNGRARVTDIGLASITQNLDFIRSSPDDQGYTVRWVAPEILNRQGPCSPEADIFSFAMVMVEVGHR